MPQEKEQCKNYENNAIKEIFVGNSDIAISAAAPL